ncbi:MAG: hypothetical protein ACJ72D_11760 [Marmoricola sp.]
MSNNTATTSQRTAHTGTGRRISTETKASFKTTELIAYVAAVVGIFIASAVADGDNGFGSEDAWRYITFLTVGYMVSRGLAKSGSRDFYDDSADHFDRSR